MISTSRKNRANHRLDDVRHQAATHADTQFRQQPTGYECAQYTHDEIDEQAIATTAHNLTGQPSGNDADNKECKQGFNAHALLQS
jgi:hypothetical protein